MRKKVALLIGILVSVSLISAVLVCVHLYRNQERIQNVFDEIIYAETSTFQENTFVMRISRNDDPLSLMKNLDNSRMVYGLGSDGEFSIGIAYDKNLPEDIKDLRYRFRSVTSSTDEVIMNIQMEIQLSETDNQYVWVGFRYFPEEAQMKRKIAIWDGETSDDLFVEENLVKEKLSYYKMTIADVEKISEEVLRKQVISDWCEVYESDFSPDDLGSVTFGETTIWEGDYSEYGTPLPKDYWGKS